MTDSRIIVPPDSLGKSVDTEQLTVAGNVVQRERIQLAGILAAEIARVLNTDPVSDDYGLVVRQAPPVAPANSPASSSSLAAGTSVDLNSALIPAAIIGELALAILTSSVACKWVIKIVTAAGETVVDTVMTGGLGGRPTLLYMPPHKKYVTLAGDGVNTLFRVTVTNLDAHNPADVYVGFYWDET